MPVTPFPEVPLWALGYVVTAFFFGFFIRGAFGFGSNMPIVLLTTWVLGPHRAIALVALTAAFAQIHLFPQGLRAADWSVVRPLLGGMIAGTALGAWLLGLLQANWLTLILGLLISVVVLTDRYRLLERFTRGVDLRSRRLTAALALTSGGLGTLSGGGGLYFLVAYLKLACPDVNVLRSTNLVLSGFFQVGRAVLIALVGLMSGQLLLDAIVLMPVVFLGTWVGTRFFHAATAKRFFAGLQLLLVGAAIALVVSGIRQVL